MKRRFEPLTPRAQQPNGSLDVPLQARHVETPYVDAQGAVDYLVLHTVANLYYHIKHNGLPTLRVGDSYRFDKRELDAWLRGMSAIELARKRA